MFCMVSMAFSKGDSSKTLFNEDITSCFLSYEGRQKNVNLGFFFVFLYIFNFVQNSVLIDINRNLIKNSYFKSTLKWFRSNSVNEQGEIPKPPFLGEFWFFQVFQFLKLGFFFVPTLFSLVKVFIEEIDDTFSYGKRCFFFFIMVI